MRILIVDDEAGARTSLAELLKGGHEVETADDGVRALALIEKSSFDLVLSDQKMPRMTGLELLNHIRERSPSTSFILITAHGSVEGAVQAIQAGADDYLLKPVEFAEAQHRIERIADLRAWRNQRILANEAAESGRGSRFVGQSKFIAAAKSFAEKVSAVPSPVLILGPSGTGKEVLARSIHEVGPRRERPFLAINCASLGEHLMESELFGHEKGAFTGATASKAGKFELAAGGTLFLDEIGELSSALQAKLLRVLQEKEFFRVGGVRQIKTDARVIAATHRPLKEMVASRQFREDLFFRLNVLTFEMTPLRERKEDLPVLIDCFWTRLSSELGHKATLSPGAREVLLAYDYPGNVRELHNLIERLIVLAPPAGVVGPGDLPAELRGGGGAHASRLPSEASSEAWRPGVLLENWIETLEASAVARAMEISGQNQVKAAELLGISRGTLQYKLRKYAGPKKAA